MTLLGELLEKVGLPHNFMGMIAREEKPSGLKFWLSARLLLTLTRSLPFLLRLSTARKEMKSFIDSHKSKLARLDQSDWSSYDEREVLQQMRYLIKIHGLTQWYVVVAGLNMMIRNKLLARFVKSNAPGVGAEQLLKGLVGLRSMEPNREIKAMASIARNLVPETLALLEYGEPAEIEQALSNTPGGQELLGAMQSFMDVYGFLSSSGTDFSATPWCENPSFIWRSIARTAAGPSKSASESPESSRSQLIAAVQSQLGPLKRVRFRRMLSRTTDYIDMRERVSMLMSEDAYQMRRLSLVMADRLLQRGILNERDDVFFLYFDEIEDLIERRLSEGEARGRIAERMTQIENDAVIEPADTVCGDQVTYKTIDDLQDQKYLVGICGSPGKVTGRARIVCDPAHPTNEFSANDILRVPFTDTGWTPLFTVVGGVVAETGGVLSHTSIVAREYGLPAIVNVKAATMIIEDNQVITLDANAGKVYLE
jgi:pyruvate,water dikinase